MSWARPDQDPGNTAVIFDQSDMTVVSVQTVTLVRPSGSYYYRIGRNAAAAVVYVGPTTQNPVMNLYGY